MDKPYRLAALFALITALPAMALSAVPIRSTPDVLWNLTDDGYVFNGYDVVSVFPDSAYPGDRQAKPPKPGEKGGYVPEPLKGDKAISVDYQGLKLAFANEANKARFEQTPDDQKQYFLPKFGGWCAKAMASGFLVPINPGSSVVLPDADGNLVFFTQAADLAREAFLQNLDEDYPNAEHNWELLVNRVQQDPGAARTAREVGIGGNVKAAGNAIASFFKRTPDVEDLQLKAVP
ncbi:MAG: hypothetical protein QNJ91_10500 [Gammaproteobacteria bacterium]|nr:hypothetical protein [Gammaproteobacteria bacterium]